ncbi:MAG: hypothetical protein EOO88_13855 [Pedobacter sp.]|nr:MAG: hypothetical protein EOO88_13855 [Pedobacter sp.]
MKAPKQLIRASAIFSMLVFLITVSERAQSKSEIDSLKNIISTLIAKDVLVLITSIHLMRLTIPFLVGSNGQGSMKAAPGTLRFTGQMGTLP